MPGPNWVVYLPSDPYVMRRMSHAYARIKKREYQDDLSLVYFDWHDNEAGVDVG